MSQRGYLEIDLADWTEVKERIARLEANTKTIIETLNSHIAEEERHQGVEQEDHVWIKQRLGRGTRPPWSVVMIITFLSALCVGLLVAFVQQGGS